MREIDNFSYMCGVIDCFNEMISAGVKQLALSHPSSNLDTIHELLPFSEEICKRYGTKYYLEESLLTTDLFSKYLTHDMKVIIYYKSDEVLKRYLSLKDEKNTLIANGEYHGDKRHNIAYGFGKLLSYPDDLIEKYIKRNTDIQ